jgi:hypothetical protein
MILIFEASMSRELLYKDVLWRLPPDERTGKQCHLDPYPSLKLSTC